VQFINSNVIPLLFSLFVEQHPYLCYSNITVTPYITPDLMLCGCIGRHSAFHSSFFILHQPNNYYYIFNYYYYYILLYVIYYYINYYYIINYIFYLFIFFYYYLLLIINYYYIIIIIYIIMANVNVPMCQPVRLDRQKMHRPTEYYT
jgi:hypothetical protein